jgi:phosphonate transport system permease protein
VPDRADAAALRARLPARPFPWAVWVSAVVAVAVLWWSAADTGFSPTALAEGWSEIVAYFGRFVPTREKPWPLDYLPQIAKPLLETIRMALGASIIGSALALPFALSGARNLAAGQWVYAAARAYLNLVRAVPDLVLATILAAIFSIGPLPGLLALTIFTFGIVSKLLCDAVETVDPGPNEAITASGGTRLERALYAVFPQVAPDFTAYALYAFEVNVRAAAVLGLVGAGGIGALLKRDLDFRDFPRVGLILFVTFVVVQAIDSFSTWLRGKLL